MTTNSINKIQINKKQLLWFIETNPIKVLKAPIAFFQRKILLGLSFRGHPIDIKIIPISCINGFPNKKRNNFLFHVAIHFQARIVIRVAREMTEKSHAPRLSRNFDDQVAAALGESCILDSLNYQARRMHG